MKLLKSLSAAAFIGALTAGPAQARNAKPGNCAILAEMTANTVEKDKRFAGHDDIAPALMKFSKAQDAKMQAEMDDTYAQSAAFGWDKAKVDQMIEDNQKAGRAGFTGPTMEKDKLYMEHVQGVYACAQAQKTPADLGQSPEALMAVLQKTAKIVMGQ